MKVCYVRFDDVCPTMDMKQFMKAVCLMDEFGIKPLIGLIPDNLDPNQMLAEPASDYWKMIKELEKKGWSIALHGLHHVYNKENPRTIICGRKHSEFAGNSVNDQIESIRKGKEILEHNGIFTDVFFAPAHTYDKNTLIALNRNGFRINCDCASVFPYQQNGIKCIPCRNGGVPRKLKKGINSIVCHTNEWNDDDKKEEFERLRAFCERNNRFITSFHDVSKIKEHSFVVQKITEKLYLAFEKIKSLIIKILKK